MSDALDDDFAPTDPPTATLELMVRGVGRREVARRLGVSLVTVNGFIATAVRQRSGEAGTPRESRAILLASLDDLQARAYAELDRDVETAAPLLEVLLGVHRLRAGLLAQTARSTNG